MELIKISQSNTGQNVVSARDLYVFLEVQTNFTNWCKRMFEYGFVENQDYSEVYAKNGVNSKAGRPNVDYALTLDCAKQIAMLQRTEKGRQARQYFIDCEKQLLALQTPSKIDMGEIEALFSKMLQNHMTVQQAHNHFVSKNQFMEYKVHQERVMNDKFVAFYDFLENEHLISYENRLSELEAKIKTLPESKKNTLKICYVYLIREGETDFYKPSFSINTKDRTSNLNVGNSQILTNVWRIPFKDTQTAKAFEQFIHELFVDKKVRGEWYKLEETDLVLFQKLALLHTDYLETMLDK